MARKMFKKAQGKLYKYMVKMNQNPILIDLKFYNY